MHSAEQSDHADVTDFRVKGRIFATFRQKDSRAVIKLKPDQQLFLLEQAPESFTPINGLWGETGWTQVALDQADEYAVRSAIRVAWSNVAPPRTRLR